MASNFTQTFELEKSFGFDCKKLNNLCLIESNIIAFVSGNLIHFLETATGRIVNRINMTGQGISFVTKNPNPEYNYLTVAESGCKPSIFIYNYADMQVISICRDGAERAFSGVNYNTSGTLMVSQGGDPDYTLTIWDWKTAAVIHRTRSSNIDVLNVVFSDHNDEQLLTGGVEHITFWRMTDTFTGPKLASLPGRFGQADVCNIRGLCALPDKKVLSNSAWGSILVWVDGQIKYEVCQKNRKPCHDGVISQILYKNGDVMTVGMDGYVRIWFWKTVQLAEPNPSNPFVEVDPTFEYRIGCGDHKCKLLSMIKGPEEHCWYAQDGNGGIWRCNLNDGECNAEMLFRCHAGGIVGIAASPFSSHIVTLGVDGRIHLYDFNTADLLCYYQFAAGGRDLIWASKKVDPSEIVLIMAFDDGVIRMACVDVVGQQFYLIQAIKSHNAPVNKLLLSETEMILISGSDDNTIFIHQIINHSPYVRILPIGLITMPSAVTALEWNLKMPFATIVGCASGEIVEVIVPNKPRSYDDITYRLYNVTSREINLDLSSIRYRANSLEEEYIENKSLGRILWLKNTPRNTVLISLSGYHSGYVHEYDLSQDARHISSIFVQENVNVASILTTANLTALGLSNGKMLLASNETADESWANCPATSAHNESYGIITSFCESFDGQFWFSVGLDGNIFSFKSKSHISKDVAERLPSQFHKPLQTDDIVDTGFLSLEEQKKKNYRDERNRFVNDKKSEMLEVLEILKMDFVALKTRNDVLPIEQRFGADELELDDRISRNLSEGFQRKMEMIRRKMAFDVEKSRLLKTKIETFLTSNLECWPIEVLAIRNEERVPMFRVPKRPDEFFDIKMDLDRRINRNKEVRTSISAQAATRQLEPIKGSASEEAQSSLSQSDDFLKSLLLSKDELKFDLQMKRLLKKYCDRKREEVERKKMWDYVNSMVPNPNILDPVDVQALQIAKVTIGNYKLKTDKTYVPTEDNIVTVEKKFTELMIAKEHIHSLRNDFNRRVLETRQNKVALCKYVEEKCRIIRKIHEEIVVEKIRVIDPVPEINEALEFAEKVFNPSKTLIKQPEQNPPKSNGNIKMSGILLSALRTARNMHKENNPNSWLNGFLTKRETKKLFEQDQILKDVYQRIEQFDHEVIALRKSRLLIEIKAKFLETNYLSVYQELWILKDFEESETTILANIDSNLRKREIDQMEYMNEKSKFESTCGNIREMEEEIKSIDETMRNECAGNKYEKFLLKTFMTNSDNTIHSGTSSMNLEYPNDCDVQLLDLLRDLKSQREAIAEQLEKERVSMKNSTGTIAQLNASIDDLDRDLNDGRDQLKQISQEKQNMLNEIEAVIVLHLDQMQYFTNEKELSEIEDTVLVNHSTITRLYQRVGQLAAETVDEQRKHRIQKMHLARLKSDFSYMNGRIHFLKEKISNVMLKKFGAIIDLDEMEESILKKFLLNFQGSAEAIDREYKNKADGLKKTIVDKEIEMLKVKQERIEKMNVLTALQEEKNMIEEAIHYQNKVHMKSISEMEFDLDKDLTKLKLISQQQQEQLKILKKEIQTLRLKAKPFDPHPLSTSHQLTDIPLYQQSSIDDSPNSTRSSFQMSNAADDPTGVRKITAVVQNFLTKITAMHLNATTLDTYTRRITSYIAQVISNYDPENGDEIVRCVSENLKEFLPKRILRYVQTSDLVQLFNEVLTMFSDTEEAEEEGEFSVEELLDNITVELKAKVSKDAPDFTGRFVCEFFEDLFGVVSLEMVNQPDHVKHIASLFRSVPALEPNLIDTTKVSAEIFGYFSTTLGNNLNKKELKRFIEVLVSQLIEQTKD